MSAAQCMALSQAWGPQCCFLCDHFLLCLVLKMKKKKDLVLGTTTEWKILENQLSRVGTNGVVCILL